MEASIQRLMLTDRVARLRAHVEAVGSSPKFEAALAKAEAQLREVEQHDRASNGK